MSGPVSGPVSGKVGSRVTSERLVLQVRGGEARRVADRLVAEEPLEVRVGGVPVAVTMRTPGNDFELALGFCLTEGIVASAAEVATVGYCTSIPEPDRFNVLDVRRHDGAPAPEHLRRNLFTSSSCGLCGTATIESVRRRVPGVGTDPLVVASSVLSELPGRLRARQSVFEATGGLHAAALFDPSGQALCVREDVGRHNAVDKVIGWAATEGRLPLGGHILVVSGRVAFEIAQKALVASIPLLAAVSAPSSMAVALADSAGMTLVGFLRGDSMNVYTHPQRVVVSPPAAGPAAGT